MRKTFLLKIICEAFESHDMDVWRGECSDRDSHGDGADHLRTRHFISSMIGESNQSLLKGRTALLEQKCIVIEDLEDINENMLSVRRTLAELDPFNIERGKKSKEVKSFALSE